MSTQFTYINYNEALVTAENPREFWETSDLKKYFTAHRINNQPNSFKIRASDEVLENQRIYTIIESLGFSIANKPVQSNLSAWFLDEQNRIQKIGKQTYRIDKLIGKGSEGDIYKAHNLDTHQVVAVKVPLSDSNNEALALYKLNFSPPRSRVARYSVIDEALVCLNPEECKNQKSGHPNIVEYYGSDVIAGKRCFAMEYVDGTNLNQYIQAHGGITQEMSQQIDSAYAHVEARGIHRPRENDGENIMVTKDGSIKLVDFGTLAEA